MIENVNVGNPEIRQPAKHEEREVLRKAPVRLTRETKINFKMEATVRHEKPAKDRKELGKRWDLSPSAVTALLKEWGFSFNDYTWGLENAAANRQFAKDLWNKSHKGAHYIRKALEGLNVLMTYAAVTQAIRKMNDVDHKIENDIRQGTNDIHRGHPRLAPSPEIGGSALRTGEKGELMAAGMNINIRIVSFGLDYSDEQTLALYKAELEAGGRGAGIVTDHRRSYGRKSFEEITMEFFPAIAAEFG